MPFNRSSSEPPVLAEPGECIFHRASCAESHGDYGRFVKEYKEYEGAGVSAKRAK